MKEDIIRQVKEAENRAEEFMQAAQVQADKILQDARHQAVEQRLKMLEDARTKAKALFETDMQAFEPELETVRQTFKAEIAKDSAQAQKRVDGVVDFVVAKFRERMGS
jgi:vacuolar-type H+-ATPase subunit H